MKWQKNTGVMPCSPGEIVSTRHKDGGLQLHKCRASSVAWDLTDSNHTYYIHKVDDAPEYDYVEPKVWTVGPHPLEGGIRSVLKNGEYQFGVTWGRDEHRLDYLIDALNAMEERNETE